MKTKFVAVLCLSMIIIFTSIGVVADDNLDEVDFLLDWVANTNHTGIYVALDKGWYQKEGIDLNIIQPSGNMSVEQVVGAAKVDFGISFQEWVTSARVQGVPIVSLAAVIQHNTSGFASLAEKNITRPRDFTGKSYGGWGLEIEKEILKSLSNGDGGDYNKLKFINIGKGDLLTMLAQNKFDLTWIFYAAQGIQAEMRGLDLNVVMLKDYQDLVPDYYTPVIISSRKYIDQNPDLTKRFMEATTRGYNYAIEYPEEAAEILYKYTPESDPEYIKKSQIWLSPRYRDDDPFWGKQRLEVWQEFGQWMYEHELIKSKFDANTAFTNKFLPGVED